MIDRYSGHCLPSRAAFLYGTVIATLVLATMVPACTTVEGPLFDRDGDGYPMGTDCNDQDSSTGPQYADQDGDGFGAGDPLDVCDLDAPDRSLIPGDCDDTAPDVYPGAIEVCDTRPSDEATPPYGVDNDCDGEVDEDVPYLTWYRDTDGDGYGVSADTVVACSQPDGYVGDRSDCDDTDPSRYPGAAEVCDDLDNDCSGGPGDYYVLPPTGTNEVDDSATTSIQAAIEAAGEGCSIVVAPGTYHEQLDFLGKGVHVRSQQGPDVTILDGDNETAVAVFQSAEGPDAILEGFTLQNGAGFLMETCCPPDELLYGGSVMVAAGSPVIRGNVITRSYAQVGGAIAVYGGNPRIEGNTISRNSSATYGAALFLYDVHNVDILDNVFETNSIFGPADKGQGIVMIQMSTLVTLSGNTFAENQANLGSGVIVLDSTNITISDNVFEHNTSNQLSGALAAVKNSQVTLQHNTFIENVAPDGGGAILCQGNDGLVTLDIRDNLFEGNDGGNDGGAIYYQAGCAGDIIHNLFSGNRSTMDGYGGAIELYDATQGTSERLTISNNLFVGNVATYGGALLSRGTADDVSILNNTFWDNDATGGGAGIYLIEDTPVIQNNLLTFSTEGNGLHFYPVAGVDASQLSYNDFYGNEGGATNIPGLVGQAGNISADPLFTDADGGTFTLEAGSPVIDAGNPDEAYNDTDGSRNDMGAYGGPDGDW